MSDATFAGLKVLVTGASRGIGRATAEAFFRAGAELAITGQRAETLEEVARALAPRGPCVLPIACHQGRPEEITRLFDKLDQRWDRLDVAVVNAATNPVMTSIVDTEKAAWDKVIEVNLTGHS